MEVVIEDTQPVLLRLEDQRQSGANCDITLCSNGTGKLYRCHKNVLMARCDYFEKMFDSGLEESKKEVIELSYGDSTIEAVLQYMYTGKLTVSLSNASEILHAFNLMLLGKVVDKIDEHLATLAPHHMNEVFSLINEFVELKKSFNTVVRKLTSPDYPDRSTLFKAGSSNTICRIAKKAGDQCNIIFSDIYEWLEDQSSESKATVYDNLDIQFLKPSNLKRLCNLEAEQSEEIHLRSLLAKLAAAVVNPFLHAGSGGFEFKVASISKLRSNNCSDVFVIGCIYWRLTCKKSEENGQEYLGVILHTEGNPSAERFRSEVSFSIQLLSSNGKSTHSDNISHVFEEKKGFGRLKFISWDQLLNVDNGFVVNDSITVDVRLVVQSSIEWKK